ncbi:MAG: DUF853 domain-containing protein [Deltaproteobacteria bacterium]|nr:DUF853 domain-containing protein [Deltaproteobacteria bacterium]
MLIEGQSRERVIKASGLYGVYEKTIDRESAYEILKAKAGAVEAEEADRAAKGRQPPSAMEQAGKILGDMARSAARSMGTQIGRQIMRGVLGSIFGKKAR